MANKIVKVLRSIRKEAGFSQGELGKRINLSRPHISNIETGKVDVSVSLVEEWAHTCEYDITMVLSPKDKNAIKSTITI